MTAIEFLEQYKEAVRVIRRCEREYRDEQLLIDAVRSLSDNDGMPHGSGISKPTEAKAVRLADKMMKIAQARLDAIEIRQEIFDVVNCVEGIAGDVLYLRHIKLRKWNDIYKLLNYSETQTWRYYKEGLKAVESIIGKR